MDFVACCRVWTSSLLYFFHRYLKYTLRYAVQRQSQEKSLLYAGENCLDPLEGSFWDLSEHLLILQELIWIGDEPRRGVSLNFPRLLWAWLQMVLAPTSFWFGFTESKGNWASSAKPETPLEFCSPLIDSPGSSPSWLLLFMVCG